MSSEAYYWRVWAGALFSSTVVTLNLARLSKANPDRANILAAGIGLAAGTMFPRTVFIATAIEPNLFLPLVIPLGAATVATYAAAGLLWRRSVTGPHGVELQIRNPFELVVALKFGAFLGAILFLTQVFRVWWGDSAA